jgi:hypothetical protein
MRGERNGARAYAVADEVVLGEPDPGEAGLFGGSGVVDREAQGLCLAHRWKMPGKQKHPDRQTGPGRRNGRAGSVGGLSSHAAAVTG